MKRSSDAPKKPLFELRVGKWHSTLHKFPKWPGKIGKKIAREVPKGIGIGIGIVIGISIVIGSATQSEEWSLLLELFSRRLKQ